MIIERLVVGQMEANCYLVGTPEGNEGLIIDPGGDARKIKRAMENLHFKFKYIINTHGHIDHIGANNDFDIPLMIHEKDAVFLRQPELNLSGLLLSPFFSRAADILLKDKDKFSLGEFVFEVIHTPGHTPGSICLRVNNFLFTGDTLFAEGVGRTDFPYASEKDLFDSIKERIFRLPEEIKILPGHGPESRIGKEKRYF